MVQVPLLRGLAPIYQAVVARIMRSARRVDPEEIEAIAEIAHRHAGLPDPFQDPRLLAEGNGFVLCGTSNLIRCWIAHPNRVLYYPLLGEQRKRGEIFYHELAHGILNRMQIDHEHGDVYDLQLALMAPWSWVENELRCRPSRDVSRLLFESNAHSTFHLSRLRVETVCTTIEVNGRLHKYA